MPTKKPEGIWRIKDFLLYIALPCFLGIILAAFIPRPIIGLIEVRDPIYDSTGKQLIKQIQYAQNSSRIKAVVLIIDCPGGTVNDTELVFLELIKLNKKKPVISMVQGLSASGAYYLSVAADEIISNPSAMIGNVGVIANLPDHPYIQEDIYSTGPYKLWGTSRDTYIRQIEVMKEAFLNAVEFGRGEKLTISLKDISRGEIYPAVEAIKIGLIDSIGPQSNAFEIAAKKAKINHYQLIDINNIIEHDKMESNPFYALDKNGEITGYPKEPGFYYLYVPDIKGGIR